MFGYRSQSAPVHVVPPQQYSVHPTGFNTGYTLLPVPTTPTNGMFYYNDQAVDNQTPFPMVPPLQQHPSTKRKRKTIVVRDPNQDNKDITEEIISEAGRSRKPTLPVGNVFSVPMPLQDKPELAFQQSDFDLEPVSTTVENSSVSLVIVEHLASAETPADEIEAQKAEPLKYEPACSFLRARDGE
ncbi:eukaryotic translation initiation factor 4 gamma 3-like isoform X1 [Silurus meridionalis]|uniref:eukaryotic translation initiation factor 4 gamma 3-like isoform X1 n=1 Tax=Silurus meridionalis TaxID=175797 RepID=UPI001EE9C8EA|nr:eukaryotic translation initiation factor 4 gamma 3-like isoform X1 [Silurus meridionalis]XP_046692082.1 eukaryotic translation initiation factor 4 gamma 3-like isoform X1 [Silurus meridionalis]